MILTMRGGRVVQEARIRAGLSQRELAERLGTTQPVIARWERGNSAPSFDRVVEAVRAAGFELAVKVLAPDDEHLSEIEELLALSPAERLRHFADRRASTNRQEATIFRQNDDL